MTDFQDLLDDGLPGNIPVLAAADTRRWQRRRGAKVVGALLLLAAFVWLGVGISRVTSAASPQQAVYGLALLVAGGAAAMVSLLAFALTRGLQVRVESLPRLERFARRNGFLYEVEAYSPDLPGRIFHGRHSSRVSVTHRVSDRSGRFELANYDPDGRGGVGYLAVRLKSPLPHLFLAGRPHSGAAPSPFAAGLGGEQEVLLEGDFPTTFALYVPKGYGPDVRYVLSPDLMALLVDHVGNYSLEIVDSWLFVYSWHPFDDDAEVIRIFFGILDVIGSRVRRRSERYRDKRALVSGGVGDLGRRLRFGGSVADRWLGAGVCVAILLIAGAAITGGMIG